jgi:hypothetical protein
MPAAHHASPSDWIADHRIIAQTRAAHSATTATQVAAGGTIGAGVAGL